MNFDGKITVRRGSLDDLPQLVDLGERMRAESEVPYPPIDIDAAREFWAAVGDNGLILVAEQDGAAIGFLTALASRYPFTRKIHVVHDIFYVAPEQRGTSAAAQLVGMFEDWALSLQAWRTIIGVHTGIKPEITGRFYEKLGYTFIGGIFVKDL